MKILSPEEQIDLNERIVEALEAAGERGLSDEQLAKQLGEFIETIRRVAERYANECCVPGHPRHNHLH